MNDEKIEELLRKAPRTTAPDGLRQRLQRSVRLPPQDASDWRALGSRSWLRRWMPALSFAVFLVACVVVIAVQTNTLTGLKQQNAELRSAGQNLEQLRTDNVDYKKLLAESQELDRLRRDKADLETLRAEVAALRAQVKNADSLRAENQALQGRVAAATAANPTNDFFAQEQARNERIQCTDNLKQLGLCFRTWAIDYNDKLPQDFISMTNEMITWKLLQCPSDKSHNVSGWPDVANLNVSYQLVAPGISDSENPQTVVARCSIHNNFLLLDGSVQQLSPEGVKQFLKSTNGRIVLQYPVNR